MINFADLSNGHPNTVNATVAGVATTGIFREEAAELALDTGAVLSATQIRVAATIAAEVDTAVAVGAKSFKVLAVFEQPDTGSKVLALEAA